MGRYREYIRKRHLVENTKGKKASCCGKKTGMLNHRDKFELVPSLLNTWLMEAVKFRTEYETQFVNNKVEKCIRAKQKPQSERKKHNFHTKNVEFILLVKMRKLSILIKIILFLLCGKSIW